MPGTETGEEAPAARFPWRLLLGGGIAAAVLAAAVLLAVLPARQAPPAAGTVQIIASMAGFEPQRIRVRAREAVRLTIVNPDSPYHADGGGWHQFRVEALGIDVRVPPRAQREITLGPLAPGRYEFYCDICCGGKDSPAMRGVIEVTG
ncbi:MAG: cupredoxin domain-containing protein [Armatimonadetes bacterium]|nr:cupredoxin domain-containing protein [Armatimonadota bacterium]